MKKQLFRDFESLNVGANVHVLGYDRVGNKVGLIAASELRGRLPWFGRRWIKGNSSPIGTPIGDLDLGQVLAKQLGLGGYLVTDGHARTKLSPNSHRYLENGAAADLTGAAGHYQWGWNVPMYLQVYEDEIGFCETISLGGPRPGFWNYYVPVGSRSCAGYATMDRTNSKLVSVVSDAAQYRGGNNNATLDETYKSQLCKPATSMPISSFRAAARKNGDLWYANGRVMQYVTATLKRIIYGNRDIEAAVNATLDANGLRQGGTGTGADLPKSWSGNFEYFPYLRLDVGVEQGDLTGVFSTTIDENGEDKIINNIPSFYGLKNDYKYLWCMSENMLLRSNEDGSQSLFVQDDIDGSLMNYSTTEGLTELCKGPAAAAAGWQYTKEYTLKNLAFFPKGELGASTSTFYCDGYYNPGAKSGLRGAVLLGFANYAGYAGSLCVHGYNAVSHASADWGAFLCEWAEAFSTLPVWCKED